MGIFTQRRTRRLEVNAGEYALGQGAGPGVADCYAWWVLERDASGAYGRPGVDHAAEWPAWCAANLGECPQCRSQFAIFVPCVSSWECWDCSHIWKPEAA